MDGGGDENKNEDGSRNEKRDSDVDENRSGGGDKWREKRGGEREPGNLRSGNRGGSEYARGGATPASNQQPQLQDPTSQQDRRIMRRTRV